MPTLTNLWVRDAPMPPVVQLAFCEEHPELVAARSDLDPSVWDHLATTRSSDSAVMEHLASRTLTATQLHTILSRKGQRAATLVAAVQHNSARIDAELVAAIPKMPATLAGELTKLAHLGPDLRYEVSRHASSLTSAELVWEWIEPDVHDARALELLLNVEVWMPTRPSSRANQLIAALFELSPGVADVLCEDPSRISDQLLLVAAASHRLTADAAAALAPRIAQVEGERGMYTQMAFVANPRVPVDVAEVAASQAGAASTLASRKNRRGERFLDTAVSECNDVDLLKWVVARSLPTEYKPHGRPWCLPDVVLSPVFGDLGGFNTDRVTAIAVGAALPEAVAARCAQHLGVDPGFRGEYTTPEPSSSYLEEHPEGSLSDVKVQRLFYMRPDLRTSVLAAAAPRLGDDPTTWRTFLELAEGFSGTLDEALDLTNACM